MLLHASKSFMLRPANRSASAHPLRGDGVTAKPSIFFFVSSSRTPHRSQRRLSPPLALSVAPPLRKRSRSARLLGCKRPRNGSLSLPTFCGLYEENGFLDAPKEETAAHFGASFCFRRAKPELSQPRAPLPLMRQLTCCKATFWSPARQLVAVLGRRHIGNPTRL